jgi:hypothetical protein
MILFLFEVIKTKPSGRTEFLGALLVVRVNVFHARTSRLSMYFVGWLNGEGDRDCGNSKELSESLSKKETRTFLRIDMVIGSGGVRGLYVVVVLVGVGWRRGVV